MFDTLWWSLLFVISGGAGVVLLLKAFIPAWRDGNWGHWEIDWYNPDPSKPARPIVEGYVSAKTAVWSAAIGGGILTLVGTGGIVWIIYGR